MGVSDGVTLEEADVIASREEEEEFSREGVDGAETEVEGAGGASGATAWAR